MRPITGNSTGQVFLEALAWILLTVFTIFWLGKAYRSEVDSYHSVTRRYSSDFNAPSEP